MKMDGSKHNVAATCVTHLVHITGPLHDVLEGSLARDVVHQEDALRGETQ